MSISFHLTAVNVTDEDADPIVGLDPFVCDRGELLELADTVEGATGEELSFGWIREPYSADDPDIDETVDVYCVDPQVVLTSLDEVAALFTADPSRFPSYYSASAVEPATSRPYYGSIEPVVEGKVYRLQCGDDLCRLVPAGVPGNAQDLKPIEPGTYDWETAEPGGGSRLSVEIRETSFMEFFEDTVTAIRTLAMGAQSAGASLLPEIIM